MTNGWTAYQKGAGHGKGRFRGEMITKLHRSNFYGYDEYLLDNGSRVYHDKDSGEDAGSELREIPIGSLVLTPKQLAARAAYKE